MSFISPKLSYNNIETYVIRKSIFSVLNESLTLFKGSLLDVGCGKMPYKDYIIKNSEVNEYIGLDIDSALEYDKNVQPDLFWDGKKMPVEDEFYDTIIATEVLEHCFEPEVVLKEIYRVLKPGGIFFFTVPFLWNLHETPFDAYRYTPFSLEKHFNNSGFGLVNIKATGGWHASMAQMLGLWIKRSPMSSKKRKILGFFGVKIVRFLLSLDKPKQIKFSEGQMITGLYGTFKK